VTETAHPLTGFTVVNAGVNLPPVAAAARLAELGAEIVKVEPPGGDPMAVAAPELFGMLTEGHDRRRLDLGNDAERATFEALLAPADVLLTSNRPRSLARLRLAPDDLARHPRLVHVSIVGHPRPRQDVAGHDLTYVAALGLLAPPALPRTLVADLGGAERAATAAVALLLGRERGRPERFAEIALEDAASFFALPLAYGVTAEGGLLGGGEPCYGIYETQDGWVAVAALEPHFRTRLLAELGLGDADAAGLTAAFRRRSADDWEEWALERDLPIAAVRVDQTR
jgi:crotonobetainyl-CoA:carnitine CoA-transferase CaiB-like acyl-CoA transferase